MSRSCCRSAHGGSYSPENDAETSETSEEEKSNELTLCASFMSHKNIVSRTNSVLTDQGVVMQSKQRDRRDGHTDRNYCNLM